MNLRQMGMLLSAVVLVLLAAFLGYQWLNAAISLDYARQEQRHQHERERLLKSLLQQTAAQLSRADLERVLRDGFGEGHVIKEYDDRIEVDDLVLKIREGTVTDVALAEDAEVEQPR